jgi:hypothetical protein
MSFSEAEARIRRLSARLGDAERRAAAAADRTLRTRQDAAGFNQKTLADRCLTTLNGRIIGGLASPLPGSSLRVVGHTTGADYGTYPAPAGTYSIPLSIPATELSLDLTAYGPAGARFDPAGTTVNRAYSRCVVNAIPALRAPAAAGYTYLLGAAPDGCAYPIANTLNWSDSLHGSGVATLGGFGWNSGCVTISSFAFATCPARATTPVFFIMRDNLTASIFYWGPFTTNSCPIDASCPTTSGFQFESPHPIAQIVARTCPDDVAKFDCTWAANDQAFHNSAAHTIRFWES